MVLVRALILHWFNGDWAHSEKAKRLKETNTVDGLNLLAMPFRSNRVLDLRNIIHNAIR